MCVTFFFFNDTATTEIYTLSLHDALPILVTLGGLLLYRALGQSGRSSPAQAFLSTVSSAPGPVLETRPSADRKSTRLNSSHANISYAVFCLKKKKTSRNQTSSQSSDES